MTPDVNHGGEQCSTQEVVDLRSSCPELQSKNPGHQRGDASECSQLFPSESMFIPAPIAPQVQVHTRSGSTQAQSEQLDGSTLDLRYGDRDLNVHDRGEHEDRGPGVQRPLDTAPVRSSCGGQDTGGAHDTVQSGNRSGHSDQISSRIKSPDHSTRLESSLKFGGGALRRICLSFLDRNGAGAPVPDSFRSHVGELAGIVNGMRSWCRTDCARTDKRAVVGR